MRPAGAQFQRTCGKREVREPNVWGGREPVPEWERLAAERNAFQSATLPALEARLAAIQQAYQKQN